MGVSAAIESMSEDEIRELLRSAEQALEQLVAKRARSTLKEAKRMAAEAGYEITFVKTGKTEAKKAKPQASRAKVLPKYRNPENDEETWLGCGRPEVGAGGACRRRDTQ